MKIQICGVIPLRRQIFHLPPDKGAKYTVSVACMKTCLHVKHSHGAAEMQTTTI